MQSVLTRDNILAAISITAFVLSMFNFIETRIQNMKNVHITCPVVLRDKMHTFLVLVFVNKSKQPIVITRMQFFIDGNQYELGKSSIGMYVYNNPDIKGRSQENTLCFPIHLDALEFERCLFYFDAVNWIPMYINALVATNRGELKIQICTNDVTDSYKKLLERLR